MEHIIDYFNVRTEALDDFNSHGMAIKKPGEKTLTMKNKYGDVLFCGTAPTMEELLNRLPYSLLQEIADRGMAGVIGSPEARLARTAHDFEEALSAFPPELIQVNVYDSRERIEHMSLDDPIRPPRLRVEIWRKTTEKVYP